MNDPTPHEKTRIRQLEDASAHWERKYANARQYNRNLEERIAALEARCRELEAKEKAAREVCVATIATGDHTQWFKPLAELLKAFDYPDNFAAETPVEHGLRTQALTNAALNRGAKPPQNVPVVTSSDPAAGNS